MGAILLLASPACPQDTTPLAPAFENELQSATNSGSIKISWRSQNPATETGIINFQLEVARSADFSDSRELYRGPDLASYISGLANGQYYYRVREIKANVPSTEWSEALVLTVKHHSLSLAFTLFGLGGVVFILTVFVVVRGARMTTAVVDVTDEQSNFQKKS